MKKKPTLRSLKNTVKEYYESGYTDSTKVLIKITESHPEWNIDLGEYHVAFNKVKEKFESKGIEEQRKEYGKTDEKIELTDKEKERTIELLKNPKLLELIKE